MDFIDARMVYDTDGKSVIDKIGILQTSVNDNSSQLGDSVKRLDEISVSLVKFPRLSGETSDSGRIERALSSIESGGIRKTLLLPPYVQIERPILLKSYAKIVGQGEYRSQIALTLGFTGSFVIGLNDSNVGYIELHDINIVGTNVTSKAIDGLNLTNGFDEMIGEAHHRLSNILIRDMSGKGMVLVGKGALLVNGISVLRTKDVGIDVKVWDSTFNNLDVGFGGSIGIKIDGGPNRFTNCKSWANNIGYQIVSDRHMLIACEAQENWDVSFEILGKNNTLDVLIDGVGYNRLTSTLSDIGLGFKLPSTATGNNIRGSGCNGIFGDVSTTCFKQLLQCSGFSNIFIFTGADWQSSVNADIDNTTNQIFINGNLSSYSINKSSVFRSSATTNKNGVYVGNDGARTNSSGIFANTGGTTNTNHGISFNSDSISVVMCGNNVLPLFNTMNIGSSTQSFKNGFFNGFIGNGAYTTATRPSTGVPVGGQIFDSTLGKPIWWNGTVWKDATGATV